VTPDQLDRRLRELPVPDSRSALAQAVKEARAEVSGRPASAPARTIWWRRLPALAAVALALVAALLTPPGRAASAWVGDLVGIGEVGGKPSGNGGAFRTPGSGIVVNNGRAPDGTRYEWVAYRCKVDLSEEGVDNRFSGVGLSLDWPGQGADASGGSCEEGAGDLSHGVFQSHGVHIVPSQAKGVAKPDLVISGSTGPEVHDVDVLYTASDGEQRELPVDFMRAEGKLRRLASRAVPLGTFVAFLPGDVAARDEVQSRLDLRALQSTGKLELGPIARRERSQARAAREACADEEPDNATLAELAWMPVRSPAQRRARDKAFDLAFAAQTRCLAARMPQGPFEYVAYGADGRVLDRAREPLILPSLAPSKPAGREELGETRLPYPPQEGDADPVPLLEARAPDGALLELYALRTRSGVCVHTFWPYVFLEGAGGHCGPEFPPVGAFGRRQPERVAARGFGFLNEAPAATRHRFMTGFARPQVARVRVLYEDDEGRSHEAPVTFARVDRSVSRRLGASADNGVWVTFVPRSAGARPGVTVIAYGEDGRELGRERQSG
jgi:hypothetical protein